MRLYNMKAHDYIQTSSCEIRVIYRISQVPSS